MSEAPQDWLDTLALAVVAPKLWAQKHFYGESVTRTIMGKHQNVFKLVVRPREGSNQVTVYLQ